MVTQEMKLLINFLQIYSLQWRINSSDHLFKQNQNLLTLSRFASTFDSKIRRILETLVPTTPVKRVYTHVPGYDTKHVAQRSDHAASAGINTPLICFMTFTLLRLFVYFDFRCKAPWDPKFHSMGSKVKSGMHFIA